MILIFYIIAIIVLFFNFYIFGVRSIKVFNFREKIRNEVFHRAYEQHSDYKNALQEYESVSYYAMVFKFWKPLKSFYKTLGK